MNRWNISNKLRWSPQRRCSFNQMQWTQLQIWMSSNRFVQPSRTTNDVLNEESSSSLIVQHSNRVFQSNEKNPFKSNERTNSWAWLQSIYPKLDDILLFFTSVQILRPGRKNFLLGWVERDFPLRRRDFCLARLERERERFSIEKKRFSNQNL